METLNDKGEKLKNNSWYNPHELPGEINEEASMTVPSMSLTVQEILEKHVRGIKLPIMRKTTFEEGDIESPQISKAIDVTEVEEMLETTKARIASKATKKSTQNSEPKAQDLSTENPEV